MTVFAPAAPTPEQIPYLWALGVDPAPRSLKPGTRRWSALTSMEKVLLAESEARWQRWVIDAATRLGWHYWHDADARKNAPGLPDLHLLREREVWAELKSETYKTTPEQDRYAERLRCAGCEIHLWRPRHKAQVLEALR